MERIELINMALFEIGRECQIVDALRTESLRHIEVIEAKGKEVPDTFRKLMADHEEALKRIHYMLRDVRVRRRQNGDGTLCRHRGAGAAVYSDRLRRLV